jgi:hypothetical protein
MQQHIKAIVNINFGWLEVLYTKRQEINQYFSQEDINK